MKGRQVAQHSVQQISATVTSAKRILYFQPVANSHFSLLTEWLTHLFKFHLTPDQTQASGSTAIT